MKLKHIKALGLCATPAIALALTSCGGGDGGSSDGGDSAAAPAAAGGADLQEVTLEFPKPLFQGTPVPVKLPNLEKTGDPKLTFKAPAGVTNLAAGKTVTSSDPLPIFGDVTLVTNGDKDGSDGNYVELGPGQQHVTIDLGAPAEIWAVNVWHFHKAACAYLDVIVQISEDAEFTNPTTIYNNDDDESSGMGKGSDPAYIETNHGRIIEANGAKGQFVRLYSKGNTANEMNHYVEVEVWGK
jgi:hypothetical protein